MKNDKILTIYNICDSCKHILAEQGENLEGLSKSVPERGNKIGYCFLCGQPILKDVNPFEKDLDLLESALNNPNIKVVCYTAPSVRVALGDEFGFEPGAFVQGKMVAALKKLGFFAVFDMNTAADFTIMEEANEFVERLEKGGNLPMFTSCCPGWVSYAKNICKNYVKNLSTTKSPQQMFGALINEFYAKEQGIDKKSIFVVSIVPCLAKKVELSESQNASEGLDVDVAITTKELAAFIKYKGIDFNSLADAEFDDFFGTASGAGAIFGNTGGVMEAVLRTVGSRLEKDQKKNLDFSIVRGLDGIRRAQLKVGKRTLNLAVVMGLKNLPVIFDELKAEPHKYDFVEVMACEGGCIGGPGQPNVLGLKQQELLKARSSSLYAGSKKRMQSAAHKNPLVQKVYSEFLGGVGSEKAKKLLHRTY